MPENYEFVIDLTEETEEPVVLEVPADEPITLEAITGDVSINNDWIEETLVGVIDGVNKIFTTINNYKSGSTRIFINGLKQKRGIHYTESGPKEITFSEAPSNNGFNDELIINYIMEI
ncbi:MAG: hypothetical protein AB1633_00220 [Elusimicrobiota bacterium]